MRKSGDKSLIILRILIAWYMIQWILAFWVWVEGGLTLVLGLPIGIMGIILFIYGIRKANSSKRIQCNDQAVVLVVRITLCNQTRLVFLQL